MKTTRLATLAVLLAAAFGAAQAQDGLTHDQVRAELAAAQRAGLVPHGDLDLRAADAPRGSFAAGSATREQVRGELAQAVARGELPSGETDRTAREIDPTRFAQASSDGSATRDQVRRELADAIRRGDLPQGDEGRTAAQINPSRYAAARAAVPSHAMASTGAHPAM